MRASLDLLITDHYKVVVLLWFALAFISKSVSLPMVGLLHSVSASVWPPFGKGAHSINYVLFVFFSSF